FEIGVANEPDLRAALHSDEEWIATLLASTSNSRSAKEDVLLLKGESAQCFLDVAQDVSRCLQTYYAYLRAWRLIGKLSKLRNLFPSSFFITGITGRERHPSFAGGFADIYRASY
ncbi:hypothetical protein C8F04DRAFT_918854, partial [Mycena alexandri]